MKEPSETVKVEAAVVTDRGLSEKRPLNEDSFLADEKRGIFAVADGVGGAQAGEVASRTAMEVLDEAFRHQVNGSDIEDLMEIAIQRANASIHRMAQEHPKLSTMATTVVALHLDGHRATIGHVGDSRLYRLAPDGELHRETRDHSVVEEEVRAGRMTKEQAAHHPSRNVISRALGAEDGVEVDMNTIDVEDGTAFLLCSDGITRHIQDDEIRELLGSRMSLEEVCDEMKRRCYERGAEDNLTAVVVRVGMPENAGVVIDELDKTVDPLATPALARTLPGNNAPAAASASNMSPTAEIPTAELPSVPDSLQPASRKAFPPASEKIEVLVPDAKASADEDVQRVRAATAETTSRPGVGGRIFRGLLLLLIGVAAGAAAAYYGRAFYQERFAPKDTATATATPSPSPVIQEPALSIEQERREVDRSPSEWLAGGMKAEMEKQGIQQPLDSTAPEFLYMYGRALFLTGDNQGAIGAFEQAIQKLETNSPGERTPLKVDARVARAAAALKVGTPQVMMPAINSLNDVVEKKKEGAQGAAAPAP
ncbi:MAG TPA: Stp1/IreP family PP2C-type Ser/Thr phosphatase [Pyrinomonadaceae bacterium]|jgi:protein phosphatase|nr:Stp1/IreP family PP2C-type Ser/Thr phosphatase [Pyrinomonadaceae bacterium]